VSDANGNSINIGDVTVEEKKLTAQESNIYVYKDFTDPIQPSGVIECGISGSSVFEAASVSSTQKVPKIYTTNPKIKTISLSGYDANVTVHDADSTLVMLHDANGKNIIKTFAGDAKVGKFSKEELSVLTATNSGFVQITPYNFVIEKINGKDIVVGTQSTYTYTGVEFK
jgi:hypothetical protein